MRNTSDRKVLHIDRVNPSPLWNYKQEDDGVLLLSIYKGGQAFEVTGQTITLGVKNSKGQLIEHKTGITISGSNVDIVLSNSIFAVKGKLECDLILKDSQGQMSSATFYLNVGQKVLGEDNVLSTNIVPTIDKIANDFETRGNKLIDDVTKDYCTLQKVIIDENASADLQNQINSVNSDLENNTHKLSFLDQLKLKFVYAAKGDGVTDDLNAFKKYVEDMPESGGTIYIPFGTYLISDTWLINKNNIIVIADENAVINLTNTSSTGNAVLFYNGTPGSENENEEHIYNCTWIGGEINTPRQEDGTANNENALGFLRAENIMVKDFKCSNTGRKAITAQIGCKNAILENIKIGKTNHNAISMEAVYGETVIRNVSIEWSNYSTILAGAKPKEGLKAKLTIENVRSNYNYASSIMIGEGDIVCLNNVDIRNSDYKGINIQNAGEIYLNNIRLENVNENNLYIKNIANSIKVYDVYVINPCQNRNGIDVFYFEANQNAKMYHKNNEIKSSKINHRYALNITTTPNFISSIGCDYTKGLADTNYYQGWKPKYCRDYFGGKAIITDDGHNTLFETNTPTSGTHLKGDRVYNTNISQGAIKGWICTESGTPGVWISDGIL